MTINKVDLNVLLKCSHTVLFSARQPNMVMPTTYFCRNCDARLEYWAVECREWHARCRDCTYSRWFGASEAECNRAAERHLQSKTGHIVTRKYVLHPDSFQYVRQQLGPKAKVFFTPVTVLPIRMKEMEEECPF